MKTKLEWVRSTLICLGFVVAAACDSGGGDVQVVCKPSDCLGSCILAGHFWGACDETLCVCVDYAADAGADAVADGAADPATVDAPDDPPAEASPDVEPVPEAPADPDAAPDVPPPACIEKDEPCDPTFPDMDDDPCCDYRDQGMHCCPVLHKCVEDWWE